jgi:effector-binding domain-containing protein
MTLKKIIALSLVILTGFLVWYFHFKPYDYAVKFTARTFPGAINQSIKLWNYSLSNAEIEKSDDLLQLKQTVVHNDSTFLYDWRITPLSDSTSMVQVFITDKDHSLHNRLTFPFYDTDFEKRVKNTVVDFNEKLKQHIGKFKVRIEGMTETEPMFCAYVSLEGRQIEKASGMMQNYSLLSNSLVEHDLELNGKPIVVINEWDQINDRIQYDFCYPIVKPDSLPEIPFISYREIKGGRAIKAVYNGNYISSDRAWYALLDYAKKEKLEVDPSPFEIFYNNPNMGGNELGWRAEIFMPLVD